MSWDCVSTPDTTRMAAAIPSPFSKGKCPEFGVSFEGCLRRQGRQARAARMNFHAASGTVSSRRSARATSTFPEFVLLQKGGFDGWVGVEADVLRWRAPTLPFRTPSRGESVCVAPGFDATGLPPPVPVFLALANPAFKLVTMNRRTWLKSAASAAAGCFLRPLAGSGSDSLPRRTTSALHRCAKQAGLTSKTCSLATRARISCFLRRWRRRPDRLR